MPANLLIIHKKRAAEIPATLYIPTSEMPYYHSVLRLFTGFEKATFIV
jgi:hypothetical protein